MFYIFFEQYLDIWRTNLINIAVALGQDSKHHNDNSIIPNLALFSYIDRHSVLWSFGDSGHWSMMVMFITFTLLLNFIFLSFYFSCLLWISSLSPISNIFFSFDEFIVETFLYFFLSFMWLPISFFRGHWEWNSQLLITSVSNSSDNYSRCYIYCFSNHHIRVLIPSMVHVFPFVFLTNFFFVY